MATALDIITLDQAKDWLEVDFPDKDDQITQSIKTAIAWVEKYTCHYLYKREITIPVTSSRTAIAYYPLSDIVMKDKDGNTVTTEVSRGTLKTYVCYGSFKTYNANTITAQAGYEIIDDIPATLIEATYKLIAYLYENHGAYSVNLPIDIQLLLNQFRRSPTIA